MYDPNSLYGEALEQAYFDDALTMEADQRWAQFRQCKDSGKEWKTIPTQIRELEDRVKRLRLSLLISDVALLLLGISQIINLFVK